MRLFIRLIWGLILTGCAVAAASEPAPHHVSLQKTDTGWVLLRGGAPYVVKGAGGDHSLEALAAAGANSIRLWDFANARPIMDEAHRLGLSVTLGIWLGHERHGFNYSDEAAVAEQLERVRAAVLEYRDHPALLIWGLGNEMEGFEAGDNPSVWQAVNDAAKLIKSLDPHHPVMTVTAELGGERIRFVHEVCDAIDIHGVNSYGGATSVGNRIAAAGGEKPYLVTEYGPYGTWESPNTAWGSPIEPTSSQKAASYRAAYVANLPTHQPASLGSYAFTWGAKMEATETWFGMWLRDGTRLGAVDALTDLWGGKAPPDLAPSIEPIVLSDGGEHDPGDVIDVTVNVEDEEDERLRLEWRLLPESGEWLTGGDVRPILAPIDDALVTKSATGATVRMPEVPGHYRLFVTAYDSAGGAATANVPLKVRGEPRTRFPVTVYHEDIGGMRWVPSGWMGETEALALDNVDTAYDGLKSLRVRFEGRAWAGIAWQHPANDWGDQPGGFDLSGAKALELWARGEYGGESVTFGVGILESDKPYPDSGKRQSKPIELTSEWQRYTVPLRGLDLDTIKTGFVITVTGRTTPVTFYLDKIRFID
ncbi:MAG: glycoside hydrolase family 2 TIM barrel-domain containing protein [Pseudomonadota bacterium]